MRGATSQAREFYGWLSSAAGITPGRFTGGPVEGGGTYRINDGPAGRSLGQESFLSRSGDLQLINRPANSLWRAPTSGIVLPAGLTSGLEAAGLFDKPRAPAAAGYRAQSAAPVVTRMATRRSQEDAVSRGLLRRISGQLTRLGTAVASLPGATWQVKAGGVDQLHSYRRDRRVSDLKNRLSSLL